MKAVILGAKGMLGMDLMHACRQEDVDCMGLDLPELDICSRESIRDGIPECDVVINSAGLTDVDGAESRRGEACAVNEEGAGNVARICRERGFRLIHISTDYVFDGRKKEPYVEEDKTNPLNVYGVSKLAGEKAVQAGKGEYIILRTQSLFGVHGRNFVKTVIGRLNQGGQLRVVADQVTSPTYTGHLAEAILRLLDVKQNGIVHVSASGSCSWYEFACAIAREVQPAAEIEPVDTVDFKTAALRPENAVLDNQRYTDWTGKSMPSWQEGLAEYLDRER